MNSRAYANHPTLGLGAKSGGDTPAAIAETLKLTARVAAGGETRRRRTLSQNYGGTIMNFLKPVTPAEARAVWTTLPNPSARNVANALSQAGRPVHFATIARWRAQGWRHVQHGPHPVEAAREALDIAARVLTGDPRHGAEFLERQGKAREELDGLTDRELLRRATRELLVIQIIVAEEVSRRSTFLIGEKIAETALLLRALSSAIGAAAAAFEQVLRLPEQSGAGENNTGVEGDPMAELLETFRSRLREIS